MRKKSFRSMDLWENYQGLTNLMSRYYANEKEMLKGLKAVGVTNSKKWKRFVQKLIDAGIILVRLRPVKN